MKKLFLLFALIILVSCSNEVEIPEWKPIHADNFYRINTADQWKYYSEHSGLKIENYKLINTDNFFALKYYEDLEFGNVSLEAEISISENKPTKGTAGLINRFSGNIFAPIQFYFFKLDFQNNSISIDRFNSNATPNQTSIEKIDYQFSASTAYTVLFKVEGNILTATITNKTSEVTTKLTTTVSNPIEKGYVGYFGSLVDSPIGFDNLIIMTK